MNTDAANEQNYGHLLAKSYQNEPKHHGVMLGSLLLASALSAGTWVTYYTSHNDSDEKDRAYQIDAQSIVHRGDKVYAKAGYAQGVVG